ncbi:hypothetical protein P8452_70420 [Trifolium repens]|nr:hypothetical protein P8452_70420 [Trifolium repens]
MAKVRRCKQENIKKHKKRIKKMQDEKITKLSTTAEISGAMTFTCFGHNYSLEFLLKITKFWYQFSVYYYGFV